ARCRQLCSSLFHRVEVDLELIGIPTQRPWLSQEFVPGRQPRIVAIHQIFQRLWDSDLQDTRIILLMRFDRKATPSARGRRSMRHFKLVSKAWWPGRHAFLVITPTYRCWLSITVTARFSPMLPGATILVRLVWSIWYAPCALPGRR